MMTENDRKLIQQARRLPWSLWYVADDYAEQAETHEAREKLRSIASALYRREELYAGSH